MDIEITAEEVLAAVERAFPREFQICVQQIQIEKLQQKLEGGEDK